MGEAVDRLARKLGREVPLAAAEVHEIAPPSVEDRASSNAASSAENQPPDTAWKSADDLLGANSGAFLDAPGLAAAFSDLETAVQNRKWAAAQSARYALVRANMNRRVSAAVDQAVSRVSLGIREILMRPGSDEIVPLAGPPAFLADKGKKKPVKDDEAAEATNDDETTEDKPVGDMKAGDHFIHPDDKKKHQLVSKKGGKAKPGGKTPPWMVRSKPADGKGAPKSKMLPGDAKLPMVKKKAAAS